LILFLRDVRVVDNKANVASRSRTLDFVRDNTRAIMLLVLVEEELP
jgi:hypothetical protein